MFGRRFLFVLILCIFVSGMLMGSVCASKTFTYGKYRGTFSDSQVGRVVDAEDGGYYKTVSVKTGKSVKVKFAKYKSKVKYKTVDFGRGKYVYGFLLYKYESKGWKYVKSWLKGRYFDDQFGTMYKHCFAKFKKTVKVKTGYRTVKYPVRMSLSSYWEDGSDTPDGKLVLSVWSSAGKIGERLVSV